MASSSSKPTNGQPLLSSLSPVNVLGRSTCFPKMIPFDLHHPIMLTTHAHTQHGPLFYLPQSSWSSNLPWENYSRGGVRHTIGLGWRGGVSLRRRLALAGAPSCSKVGPPFAATPSIVLCCVHWDCTASYLKCPKWKIHHRRLTPRFGSSGLSDVSQCHITTI
jgi:hypothetical protein